MLTISLRILFGAIVRNRLQLASKLFRVTCRLLVMNVVCSGITLTVLFFSIVSSHGTKDQESSADNDKTGVTVFEPEDRYASSEPGCDSVAVYISSPSQEMILGGCKDEQKRFSESEIKPMEHVKFDRNSRIKSADENNLPVLPYEEMNAECTEVSLCNESSYRNTAEINGVISTTLPKEKMNKTSTVVPSASRHTDDASTVILAQQLPFNNVDKNKRANSSTLPYEDNGKTKTVVSNQAVVLVSNQHGQIDEVDEVISATELKQTRNGPDAVISQHLPYAKENKTDEVFPYKQVDEINELISPLSQYKKMDEKNSVTFPNSVLSSGQGKSNTPGPGEEASNTEKSETSIILSPILPNRKAHDKSNEVNVFIDYRNKTPVSVEFSEEDVSFLKTLGSVARMSRKSKQNTNGESRIRIGRNNNTVLDGDISERTEQNVKNEGEINHSRLSRKDRHEQDVLTNKLKIQNLPGKHFIHAIRFCLYFVNGSSAAYWLSFSIPRRQARWGETGSEKA